MPPPQLRYRLDTRSVFPNFFGVEEMSLEVTPFIELFNILLIFILGKYFNFEFLFLFPIFSGRHAVVRRCEKRDDKKEYAAKYIRKRRSPYSRRGVKMEDICKEVSILREMIHPNVVKLYDVYDNGPEVILILEL